MTLHWWMHWFWVTSLLTLHASIGITHAAPQSEELRHVTDVEIEQYTQLERQSRAMYYPKTFQVTSPIPVNVKEQIQTEKDVEILTPNLRTTTEVPLTTWSNTNASEVTTVQNNVSNVNESVNLTETQNVTFASKKRNLTRPDYVKDDGNIDGVSESRIVTEKPLSLETTFLQTRIPPNIESSRRVIDHDSGGMDTGAIAGISFAAVVLVALAGSTAFVLYRRRYLNKPQTLNDKCSNPDSSGYLDDSTVRDNSEEMYSLDNDSFLNSLEAMTIQNYWTDTVKHTKL